MEIGDIVTIVQRNLARQTMANTPSRIFKGDGEIPARGRIEYMNDKFATLMLINASDGDLYRESFRFEELSEA